MTEPSLNELRTLIARHGARGTAPLRGMPGLIFGVESAPTPPCQIVVEPVFSLIAQGAKRVEVGKQIYDYRAGQYLVVSVDLPVDAYVVEATPAFPNLGCGMTLRPEAIASLLLDSGGPRTFGDERPGIAISDLSSDLVGSVVRLLSLLDRPSDIPILAASLEREILWRLINGPQGAIVRQIGLADAGCRKSAVRFAGCAAISAKKSGLKSLRRSPV